MFSEIQRPAARGQKPPLFDPQLLHRLARVVSRAGLKTALITFGITLLVGFSSGRAAAVDTLLVTTNAAQPVVAGVPFTVTITAMNGAAVDPAYTGSIAIKTSDPLVPTAPDVTIGAGDNGVKTFNIALDTAGQQTITATDKVTAAITGKLTVTVADSGQVASFALSGFPNTTTSNTLFPVVVTAKDGFGNTVVGYRGTIQVTSTDPKVPNEGPLTFTAATPGIATFQAHLASTGVWVINVTDNNNHNGSSTGITVSAGNVTHFVFTGVPNTVTAGVPFTFTVTAEDVNDNPATGYTGTLNILTNDPLITNPPSHTFGPGDNGSFTFFMQLDSAGVRGLVASDPVLGIRRQSPLITVVAGTVSHLVVTGTPTDVVAGHAFTFTVLPIDVFGNTVANYNGTVTFTSSDPAAQLPPDYTFGGAVRPSLRAVLNTVGTQTISATSTMNPGISGISAGINVVVNSVVGLTVNPSPVVGGKATSLTVTLATSVSSGTDVTIISNSPSVAGLTVTIPNGQTSVTVPLPTTVVDHVSKLSLTASANGTTLSAPLTLTPFVSFDFDGDGHTDLLLQQRSTGAVYFLPFNGVNQLGFGSVLPGGLTNFNVVGTPDVNGDFNHDLLLESPTTGAVAYVLLDGSTTLYNPATPSHLFNDYLFRSVTPGFLVAGTPDLNGDGVQDIIFENQTAGDSTYVLMNGMTPGATGTLFHGLDKDYHIVATPDINNDGYPDIVWQSKTTGKVVYQLMKGVKPLPNGFATLFNAVQPGYVLVGAPDLNGDGNADFVFQNVASGDVSYVLMNGTTVIGYGFLLNGLSSDMRVVGIH